MTSALVTPGEPLFPSSTHAAGTGTHVRGGSVCASVVGIVAVAAGPDGQHTVTVARPAGASVVVTPTPGDTVTVRVLRTSSRAAGVEILALESHQNQGGRASPVPLPYPPPGVIRAADVRATAVDSVDVGALFRPGDLVRAVVLSVGDARAYYLSTAGEGLGVVSSRSAAPA